MDPLIGAWSLLGNRFWFPPSLKLWVSAIVSFPALYWPSRCCVRMTTLNRTRLENLARFVPTVAFGGWKNSHWLQPLSDLWLVNTSLCPPFFPLQNPRWVKQEDLEMEPLLESSLPSFWSCSSPLTSSVASLTHAVCFSAVNNYFAKEKEPRKPAVSFVMYKCPRICFAFFLTDN